MVMVRSRWIPPQAQGITELVFRRLRLRVARVLDKSLRQCFYAVHEYCAPDMPVGVTPDCPGLAIRLLNPPVAALRPVPNAAPRIGCHQLPMFAMVVASPNCCPALPDPTPPAPMVCWPEVPAMLVSPPKAYCCCCC